MKIELEASDDLEESADLTVVATLPDSPPSVLTETLSKLEIDVTDLNMSDCDVDENDRFRIYLPQDRMLKADLEEVMEKVKEAVKNPRNWVYRHKFGDKGGDWHLCQLIDVEMYPW